MSSLEERVAELERRLDLLEARAGVARPAGESDSPQQDLPNETLVKLSVSNKRYDHGDYEDHIWFDCVYTLSQKSKPTRAVKGVIEFSDLFGEVKFRIQATVNDPLVPGIPLANPGIGFTFNEFMQEHQWMLTTDLSNMMCKFSVSNVLYSDGTAAAFTQ